MRAFWAWETARVDTQRLGNTLCVYVNYVAGVLNKKQGWGCPRMKREGGGTGSGRLCVPC